MIAFLGRSLSINLKRTVLARHSIRAIGSAESRWRFSSKLEASASTSILVEHLRNCRPMSLSALQFWVWPCQIHGRDCLAHSNVWSRAIFYPATRTISFGRWTPDFNSGRLQISRVYAATANKQIMAA